MVRDVNRANYLAINDRMFVVFHDHKLTKNENESYCSMPNYLAIPDETYT